jgi:hypothetical protein
MSILVWSLEVYFRLAFVDIFHFCYLFVSLW